MGKVTDKVTDAVTRTPKPVDPATKKRVENVTVAQDVLKAKEGHKAGEATSKVSEYANTTGLAETLAEPSLVQEAIPAAAGGLQVDANKTWLKGEKKLGETSEGEKSKRQKAGVDKTPQDEDNLPQSTKKDGEEPDAPPTKDPVNPVDQASLRPKGAVGDTSNLPLRKREKAPPATAMGKVDKKPKKDKGKQRLKDAKAKIKKSKDKFKDRVTAAKEPTTGGDADGEDVAENAEQDVARRSKATDKGKAADKPMATEEKPAEKAAADDDGEAAEKQNQRKGATNPGEAAQGVSATKPEVQKETKAAKKQQTDDGSGASGATKTKKQAVAETRAGLTGKPRTKKNKTKKR